MELLFLILSIFNTIFTIYACFEFIKLRRGLSKLAYLFSDMINDEETEEEEEEEEEEDEDKDEGEEEEDEGEEEEDEGEEEEDEGEEEEDEGEEEEEEETEEEEEEERKEELPYSRVWKQLENDLLVKNLSIGELSPSLNDASHPTPMSKEDGEEDGEENFVSELFAGTFQSIQEGKSLDEMLRNSMKKIEDKFMENPELVSNSEEYVLNTLAKKGVFSLEKIESVLDAVKTTGIFTEQQVSHMKNRFSNIRENLIEFGDTGDERNLEDSVVTAQLAMDEFYNEEFLGKAREKLKGWMRNPADLPSSPSSTSSSE